eukprot:CAMPEP_0196746938 /NCGR_PEP_ID=MMETSP1091-20130531/67665_1 /TAXON_ID=302021 /ORGANISM="Rhodomonas sp., Strain CCMP768" /LENGTH=60 /DNA_ID=CAMNT_0042093983 /DNA_START=18 /DNA_END=197 /DNA_ORIENTATION=+
MTVEWRSGGARETQDGANGSRGRVEVAQEAPGGCADASSLPTLEAKLEAFHRRFAPDKDS